MKNTKPEPIIYGILKIAAIVLSGGLIAAGIVGEDSNVITTNGMYIVRRFVIEGHVYYGHYSQAGLTHSAACPCHNPLEK